MGSFIRAYMPKGTISRFAAGQKVLAAPFGETRGKKAAKIMRTGPRGVREQFRDQTEYREDSSSPWEKKKRFGTKSARGKTMLASGAYRKAWLGGAGGTETIADKAVSIGVDPSIFPQVKIHQGRSEFVRIFPKKHTKSGQWAMRFALHYLYGVWLTNATLEKGLKVYRRRISISKDVRSEVAKMLKQETGKKMGLKIQGPREVAA